MTGVLVVHPGASWATHDVHMGVVEGLRAHGVRVCEFRLDTRIQRTHDFLHYLWRKQRRAAPERAWPKPSDIDVLHQASQGMVERALEKGCSDILVVSAMYLMPDRIALAKRAGLRVWLLCTETPYAMAQELRLAGLVDGVWTHERAVLDQFLAVNSCAGYLPHAWRPGVHDLLAPAVEPTCDVLFCGSLFEERIQWMEAVDWTGIDLALYGTPELLAPHSPLRAFVRGGLVKNADLVGIAQRARVALNLFRAPDDGHPAESLNPRLYEMAAAGVCSVSDGRAEVAEKFGDAMPTFSTPSEASAVIRELLAHPARREACAARARAAVASDSWAHRAHQMIDDWAAWQTPERQQRSA